MCTGDGATNGELASGHLELGTIIGNARKTIQQAVRNACTKSGGTDS